MRVDIYINYLLSKIDEISIELGNLKYPLRK